MDVATHVLVLLVSAAFVAGWIDAVVGGGGLVQLPSLLIGLPADTPVATVSGTNKVSAAAGTAMATATYLRVQPVQWVLALPLMASAWLGSTAGARCVRLVPREAFTPVVLIVLVVVGTWTLHRPRMGLEHSPRSSQRAQVFQLCLVGLLVGLYDGLIGPGTGTFFVFAMVGLLGYGFLQASVLTKLANLTTNLAAITVLGLSGHILWGLAGAMAAANLLGGFFGARAAVRHGNAFVRKVFLVVVGMLTVKLGWDVFTPLVAR